MTTHVLAAPISLDVRAMMIGGGGSNGLSRVSPGDACLSRVKRCLFGPARSAQEAVHQAQLVAHELQRQSQADAQRWNFDFVAERPLRMRDARFTWTPCASSSSSSSSTPSSSPSNSPANSATMRQSQITEFLKPRKRNVTSNGIGLKSSKRLRVHCEAKPRRT